MIEMIKFPSINQLRNTVKKVSDRSKYHGVSNPVLKFTGTVKLHGTNAGVVQDLQTNEIWFQSRENVITPEKDNAGFAGWGTDKINALKKLIVISAGVYGFNNVNQGDRLAIYGEWCGGSIQKKVAITGLKKMFVVFGIRIIPKGVDITDDEDVNETDNSYWFSVEQLKNVATKFDAETVNDDEDNIYFIHSFKSWEVEIDFNRPDMITNQLIQITDEVEKECPVGKEFGSIGVGEGVVWNCDTVWKDNDGNEIRTKDLTFKVKGQKHSESKVKQTASVDVELMNSIMEFVDSTVTDHRLEKKLDTLRERGFDVSPKNTGEFIKIVAKDILDEEGDTLEASNLDWKKVAPHVATKARSWFLNPSILS